MSTSNDTGAAKLPGLPTLNTSDQSLARWAQAVAEHLEVRAGARGNPLERSVTQRELDKLARQLAPLTGTSRTVAAGDIPINFGGGLSASISVSQFAQAIRNTQLFKDLSLRLDDPTRFDRINYEVRKLLLADLGEEARVRGAAINRLENKLQTATDSLAYRVEEVTAAVGDAAAGVREVAFAAASDGVAQAGKTTQLVAALDGTGSATIEDSLIVIADRTTGLSAQSMLKLSAGGAISGIGLMATEDPTGATESAVIIQADKFAIVSPGYSGGPVPSPDSSLIPFGVDASGVYINGTVRINASGATLNSMAAATGIYISQDSEFFKYDTSGSVVNGTITLTANLTAGITGTVTWSVLSGYGTISPSGNTLVLSAASMTGDTAGFQISLLYSGTTYTDTVTIVKLRDGANAVTAFLTNESHTVPASFTGVVSSWTGASTNIKVFQGAVDTTAQWAFTRVDSGLTTTLAGSGTATVTLTATALPGDVGTSTITGTRAGYGNITKVFTLAKSKAGPPGGNGLDGDQGLQGEPGATTYTWIAYANNATGTVDFTIGENIGQTYIGIANNKLTPNESTDAAQYTWSLIKGDQGVPGNPGLDGAPTYTWFAYATNATGTTGFTTGAWTNQTYIGIASNKASATEGTNPADYSWSLIKGADGANGTNGSNGSNGADGARGSMTFYATGSSWTDATANSKVLAITGSSTKVIGDTVTISTTGFAATKYWSGSAWVAPGVVIDGNLLVSGTVSATTLNVQSGGVGVTIAGGTAINSAAGAAVTNGAYIYQNSATLYGLYVKNLGKGAALFETGAAGGYAIDCFHNSAAGAGYAVYARSASSSSAAAGLYSSGYHGARISNQAATQVGLIGLGSQAKCFYAETGTFGPFTGSHDALILPGHSAVPGDIVVDYAVKARKGVSDTICEVRLSAAPNQKGVVGVFVEAAPTWNGFIPAAMVAGYETDDSGDQPVQMPVAAPEYTGITQDYRLASINALGEGQINVCGEGGNLEIGDLIVSSSTPGKGMRQGDDLVRSYTVAKSREAVTFASPGEVKMVACIYLCG